MVRIKGEKDSSVCRMCNHIRTYRAWHTEELLSLGVSFCPKCHHFELWECQEG